MNGNFNGEGCTLQCHATLINKGGHSNNLIVAGFHVLMAMAGNNSVAARLSYYLPPTTPLGHLGSFPPLVDFPTAFNALSRYLTY